MASSAAMAVGAVAASSGLLSQVSGDLARITGDGPTTMADGPGPGTTGSDIPSPLGGTTAPAPSGTTAKANTPTAKSPSARPSATPTRTVTHKAATPTPTRTTAAPTTPVTRIAPHTTTPSPSKATDAVTAARAQILTLVNQQRATAGCKPLTASAPLTTLAQDFSDEMAARGFFDHTDPDGNDPWDRAAKLGISNLGGENIAMGQPDAQAVMNAWMNSPGHRANILNCQYTTLGVGVHFGSGGPWWTQDFGF